MPSHQVQQRGRQRVQVHPAGEFEAPRDVGPDRVVDALGVLGNGEMFRLVVAGHPTRGGPVVTGQGDKVPPVGLTRADLGVLD